MRKPDKQQQAGDNAAGEIDEKNRVIHIRNPYVVWRLSIERQARGKVPASFLPSNNLAIVTIPS